MEFSSGFVPSVLCSGSLKPVSQMHCYTEQVFCTVNVYTGTGFPLVEVGGEGDSLQ